MKINVVKNTKNNLPAYEYAHSAGMDVRAELSLINKELIFGENVIEVNEKKEIIAIHLAPNSRLLVPTGLHLGIPEGYEVQARPRSGLALKYGITLTNCVGTIDCGYAGDCGFILHNTGHLPFTLNDGERIGQFV